MENDTNVDTAPVEQGNTDVETEGKGETEQPKPEAQEKMLPQSEVNKLIAAARKEGRESGKKEALKDYEGKHVLTEDDLSTIKTEAAQSALKHKELETVRKEIVATYGVSEAFAARLEGDNTKALWDDAKSILGEPKKKPAPILNPGATPSDDSSIDEATRAILRGLEKVRT